jgi:hypothetical protein
MPGGDLLDELNQIIVAICDAAIAAADIHHRLNGGVGRGTG